MIESSKIIQVIEIVEKVGEKENFQDPERQVVSYYLSNNNICIGRFDPIKQVQQQMMQTQQKTQSQNSPKVEENKNIKTQSL